MRRVSVILSLVCAAVASLAQNPTSSNNQPGEDPASVPCVVAGRVVTAAEGNPVKSARVALTPEHSRSHTQIYAATTDVDGRFTIKDIPPGRYTFLASHSGFVMQQYKAPAGESGPIFTLSSGAKVSDVLFRLVAAAVITGRVSNEDGDPMQRVEVVALRRPSEEEIEEDEARSRKIRMHRVASAESDDRGQYRIFGLKPGEYYLRAEDTFHPQGGVVADESYWLNRSLGSEYASLYYPGVTQVSQAQVIPIKAGEEVQADVVMHRAKTVNVAGRVVGTSGPVANTMVHLESADLSDSDLNRGDTTDEKGNFLIRNVPEGTYYVVAFQRQENAPIFEARARQKIEVMGENIESLTISLGGGATIQGRIRVDGASSLSMDRVGLMLLSDDEDGQIGGHADVKKDGSFEIKSVHDGSYSVHLWGLDRDAYVKSVRRGPDDLLDKGLQVEGNASGRIELVVASDGAQLDGAVADDDGPVIGARVRIVPDPLTAYNRMRIHRTTTDQTGHFQVTDIAPGKYKLTAKPMVSSESSSIKSEPQAVTLSENDHKTVQVKLEKQQEQ
jgi:Carboxypeptidase regulatory-like domain